MSDFWGFFPVDSEGQIVFCYDDVDWRDYETIALELRKSGVPVWYDYGFEAGTKEWKQELEKHLRKANAVVFLIEDRRNLFYYTDEFGMWAFNTARKLKKPIIPIFAEGPYFDGEKFLEEWKEYYPDDYKEYFNAHKQLIRSAQVRYDPESESDTLQSVAAKVEEHLLAGSLFTRLRFDDDPREILRLTRKTARKRRREEHRFLKALFSKKNGWLQLLIYILLGLAIALCTPGFRQTLKNYKDHERKIHSAEYTMERADDALGISEPLYFDADDVLSGSDLLYYDAGDGHLPIVSFSDCAVIADHYGFFTNDDGKDCIMVELNYVLGPSRSDAPVLLCDVNQGSRKLQSAMLDYAGYSFLNQSDNKNYLIYEGVDLSGGSVVISMFIYYEDDPQLISERHTFACPIPDGSE